MTVVQPFNWNTDLRHDNGHVDGALQRIIDMGIWSHAFAHSYIYSDTPVPPDTLLIHPRYLSVPMPETVPANAIILNVDLPCDAEFFAYQYLATSTEETYRDWLTLPHVPIYVPWYGAPTFIGYYYTTTNTMVASCWLSHGNEAAAERLWPVLFAALNLQPRIVVNQNPVVTITIGADPEFELMGQDGLVYAERIIRSRDRYADQLGVDGAGGPVEFRPGPGTPEEVVSNISSIIDRFVSEYSTYDLSPTGDQLAVGGHIHIGLSGPGVDPGNMSVRPEFINALDAFVGAPWSRFDGSARGGYRGLHQWRNQYHGIEYRTPPSYVFARPDMCLNTLKVVYSLAQKHYNGEVIEYHNPATLADYMNSGGLNEAEATALMQFFSSRRDRSASLLAFWGKTQPTNGMVGNRSDGFRISLPDGGSVIARLRDSWWNPRVRSLIESLEQAAANLTHDQLDTINGHIMLLYGLGTARGEVTTLSARTQYAYRCLGTYPTARVATGRICIGLPYEFRMSHDMSRSTIDQIARACLLEMVEMSPNIPIAEPPYIDDDFEDEDSEDNDEESRDEEE